MRTITHKYHAGRQLQYIFSAFALLAILLLATPHAMAEPLAQGDIFPAISINGSVSEKLQDELGLKGKGPHTLTDIKSSYVLIEVFSMYCPFCQAEAPTVNELYSKIQNSPMAKKLAVIGLGAGNSQYEVDFFRKKYSIPFALFTDEDLKIHKQIGETKTPHFYLIDLSAKTPTVAYSHTGVLKSADAMFTLLQGIIAP